jgi:hypothetical protein
MLKEDKKNLEFFLCMEPRSSETEDVENADETAAKRTNGCKLAKNAAQADEGEDHDGQMGEWEKDLWKPEYEQEGQWDEK